MFRLKKIGEVQPVASINVKRSKLGLGFEKLDRDVFDPEKAYPYVASSPLSNSPTRKLSNFLAFGETRRIKRTETRRDSGIIVIIACTFSPYLRTPC
jgi:hypothetical protein